MVTRDVSLTSKMTVCRCRTFGGDADWFELRGILSGAGVVSIAFARNGGAEGIAGPTRPLALGPMRKAPTMSSGRGSMAYRALQIQPYVRTLAEMRAY